MSFEKVMSYEGIQREYANCLRQLQIIVYRRLPYERKVTIREVRRNAELLDFLCKKKFCNEDDLKNYVNGCFENFSKLKDTSDKLSEEISETERAVRDIPEYFEIRRSRLPTKEQKTRYADLRYLSRLDISSPDDVHRYEEKLKRLKAEREKILMELEAAEAEKNLAGAYYDDYLQTVRTDYDILLERAKREYLEYAEREENELSSYRERTESERTAGERFHR